MNDYETCIYCSTKITDIYCSQCGWKIATSEEEWMITDYFRKGYSYKSILKFLEYHHDIKISLRTLKTKLKDFGLQRRSPLTSDRSQRMEYVIGNELQGPSSISGYRTMWSRLRLFHNVAVSRDAVMLKLREMDPVGCEERRRRRLVRRKYVSAGPNAIWHQDGYDKLKPFGFPIHGCVDGYSRKILWLRTVHSNNDPVVIGRLFLNCVIENSGCPARVRSDCGSENVLVASIQSYLRRSHTDIFSGTSSFIYGTSHGNQRIEGWWSFYRRNRSSFIINFFKDMVSSGAYNAANTLQVSCVRYCFGNLLQNDLDEVVEHWNSHFIRKSGNETISGRPDELFYFPDSGDNQLKEFEESDLNEMDHYIDNAEEEPDDEMERYKFDYFDYLVTFHNMSQPTDWHSALRTYNTLISHAE